MGRIRQIPPRLGRAVQTVPRLSTAEFFLTDRVVHPGHWLI
jgi:hypothetical protein